MCRSISDITSPQAADLVSVKTSMIVANGRNLSTKNVISYEHPRPNAQQVYASSSNQLIP